MGTVQTLHFDCKAKTTWISLETKIIKTIMSKNFKFLQIIFTAKVIKVGILVHVTIIIKNNNSCNSHDTMH